MIILNFRFNENFNSAFRLLQTSGIPFEAETARDGWRPNLIYLFETDIPPGPQRDALKRARELEREDHARQKHHSVPNLAEPL